MVVLVKGSIPAMYASMAPDVDADEEAADALETCVYGCWEDGILSKDLDPDGPGTEEITDAVCERLVR